MCQERLLRMVHGKHRKHQDYLYKVEVEMRFFILSIYTHILVVHLYAVIGSDVIVEREASQNIVALVMRYGFNGSTIGIFIFTL